ncbi:MAG: PAS domain-containing protein [Deltaproteobacteria bacterium]|nr:PAS domain-containing protein [Deltaproteobacteria bacterium]
MLENVIEAMVDVVLVVDVDGRITLTNSAATRLTGYTRDQLRTLPIAKLLVDDNSGMRTVVRRRIEDGDVLRREESWLVTATNQKIPVSVTGSPVLSDQGVLQGIVLVAHDVRELHKLLAEKEAEIVLRKEVEEELRAAKASIEENLDQARTQLVLAERRGTLGTLAAGVGHELRNIAQIQVAAVDELAAALEAKEDLSALTRAILPDLERVANHITEHGRRLLHIGKPGPDHVEHFDLNVVVKDVINMMRSAGKLRRVEVEATLGPEPLQVTVNRTRIEQILVNLMINAVDAIGETHGKIAIAIRPSPDGKRVLCEVRDTGSGIAPDALEKVFTAFYTTKPPDRGTGLGLPVAREIVQSYGGDLTVQSTLGVGTSFTFDLPR